MIDARTIYGKVTRKIFEFSPEQEQNLLAIVWLYRGETGRYLDLVAGYCQRMLAEGASCFVPHVGADLHVCPDVARVHPEIVNEHEKQGEHIGSPLRRVVK